MTSRSRSATAAFVVLVLLICAFLIGRATGGSLRAEPSAPEGGTGIGPASVLHGVPVGYEHSEEGAVSAAANFARVMANVGGGQEDYIKAWSTMAAPAWRLEARELAETGFDFTIDRYGSDGTFSYSPIRYRLDEYSPTGATVDLWGVTVAAAGSRTIEESWTSLTLDLTWISGDWRLSGQESATGPSPQLVQAGEVEPPSSLDGFEEFSIAPQP